MKFKQIPTNQVEIVVTPRNKGDFGSISIGGWERTPKEEYSLAEEIKSNIERHVDDIGSVSIHQEHIYETPDGQQYLTLYEALYDQFSESTHGYSARYEHPSDNGVGTRTATLSFERLIEKAYLCPWNFKVVTAYPPLTEQQEAFLNAVLAAGLEAKQPAKVGEQ